MNDRTLLVERMALIGDAGLDLVGQSDFPRRSVRLLRDSLKLHGLSGSVWLVRVDPVQRLFYWGDSSGEDENGVGCTSHLDAIKGKVLEAHRDVTSVVERKQGEEEVVLIHPIWRGEREGALLVVDGVAQGDVSAVQGAIGLVAELIGVEVGLRSEEERMRIHHSAMVDLFEFSPDALFVVKDGRIVYVNGSAMKFCRGEEGSLSIIGCALDRVIAIEEVSGASVRLGCAKDGAIMFDWVVRSVGGGQVWTKTMVILGRAGGEDDCLLLVRDRSVEAIAQRMLNWSVDHDRLTGLLNRAGFVEAVSKFSEGFLLCVNLDHFRVVNDALGYDGGDELLVVIGGIIKRNVRSSDAVARDGGDEFIVGLGGATEARAKDVALRIAREISESSFEHQGQTVRVTAAIGIARLDEMGASGVCEARARADHAAYAAKLGGRSGWLVWNRELETKPESELASAIMNGLATSRLQLLRQKIESVKERKIGFEVLARVFGGDGVLICADKLFGVAERYGLTVLLDRRIVGLAIENYETLVAGGDYLTVNVSMKSTRNLGLAEWIVEECRAAQVPARGLCVEITETAQVEDTEATRAFIEILRGGGILVALDDFGSGAAGFALLTEYEVDVVKLDGRYMKNVATSVEAQQIARSIVEMAGVFGFMLVAEWIESEPALEWAQKNGIDAVQGYFVGRPEVMLPCPVVEEAAVA